MVVQKLNSPLFCRIPNAKHDIAPLHLEDISEYIVRLVRAKLNDPCAVLELDRSLRYKIEDVFKQINENHIKKSKLFIGGDFVDYLLGISPNRPKRKYQNSKNILKIENIINTAIFRKNCIDTSELADLKFEGDRKIF
jgi:hypothetical protein